MDQASNLKADERGSTKRPHGDDMKATPKRVCEESYPTDGAPAGAYPRYDTTMETEAQHMASNAAWDFAAINATQSPHMRQDAEFLDSRAAQEHTTPPPSYFASAVPYTMEDQNAYTTTSFDPGFDPYVSSFLANLGPGYMGGYQTILATMPSDQPYQASQSGFGGQQQLWSSAPIYQTGYETYDGLSSQNPSNSSPSYGRPTPGTTAGSSVLSPQIQSSVSVPAGSTPETPATGISDMYQEPIHAGQKRPMSGDDAETSQAKKARSDSIERHKQEYYDNKPAIDHWWLMYQKITTSPWYEKLMSWKAKGSLAVKQGLNPVVPSSTPAIPTQTAAMETPTEILQIRQQWGDERLNSRTHPLDKVDITNAQWPREDTLLNSHKRPNGNYNCLHTKNTFDCCHNGLSEKTKKSSIHKQIRNFKARVEDMIVKKDLHVAHKTWTNWLSDKKFKAAHSVEIRRIDGLLAAVAHHARLLQAPAAPARAQAIPQQHHSRPVASATVKPTPQFQRPDPIQQIQHAQSGQAIVSAIPKVAAQRYFPTTGRSAKLSPEQQANHMGPSLQQIDKNTLQRSQMQQSGAVARPQARPAAIQKQHETQRGPVDTSSQTHPTMSSIPVQSIAASHQTSGVTPRPEQTRKPLPDDRLRLKAAGAIHDQNERSSRQRLVIIAGIDLSKEDCHGKYEHVLRKVVAALKQREARKNAATAADPSATSPILLNGERQQAPQQPQTPPPAIAEQARARHPWEGVGLNRVVASDLKSTPVTPTPHRKADDINCSHSTGGTSLFTPSPSGPEATKPVVNYRREVMRMFQQLVKDNEPIVRPGLKITMGDITTDMNGCVDRLAPVLKQEAEDAARRQAEEPVLSGSEDAAKRKDNDDPFAMPDSIANGNDVLNHLFLNGTDDTPGEDNEQSHWHLPSSTTTHDSALRIDAAPWADYAPPPGYTMNPQSICDDALEQPPLPPDEVIQQPQPTDLEYLDVLANWYTDPGEVLASGPAVQWSEQDFTEELSHFDLDGMTPLHLQDRLTAIKEERNWGGCADKWE
ncbi:hypothetical protein G6011_06779 [Alternaria panax]|uniref:Uncharacterized protein n=1 Tax=Alternaria panax TaxID=48097 RepID=A0AAD4I9I0_9PLEO|nr:hypothetical protein G6011_06779 [Alternaria panax]